MSNQVSQDEVVAWSSATEDILPIAKSAARQENAARIDVRHLLVAFYLHGRELLANVLKLDGPELPKELTSLAESTDHEDPSEAGSLPEIEIAENTSWIIDPRRGRAAELSRQSPSDSRLEPIHVAAALFDFSKLRLKMGTLPKELKAFPQVNDLSLQKAESRAQQFIEEHFPESSGSSSEPAFQQIREVQSRLQSTFFGQDHAIDRLTETYLQQCEGLGATREGPASLLFVGEPGTGKTSMARTFSQELRQVGEDRPFVRLDMSNYTDPQTAKSLVGREKAFRGSETGDLTGIVANNERSIILLDEIDRAHPQAHNIILRALGEGSLRDHRLGREVSFGDSLFILTTNAGRSLYGDKNKLGYFTDTDRIPRSTVLESVREEMPPSSNALLDRIGETVVFAPLSFTVLQQIGVSKLEDWRASLKRRGIDLDVIPDLDTLAALLVLHCGPNTSARGVERAVDSVLDQRLTRWQLQNAESGLETLKIVLKEEAENGIFDIESRRRELRVLCVDDDASYLDKLSDLISEHCHFFGVTSVQEAKDRLAEDDFDLLLLDLQLKESQGQSELPVFNSEGRVQQGVRPALRLLKHIREQHPDVPVYIHSNHLTSRDDPAYDAFIEAGGAAGFVPKPGPKTDSTEIQEDLLSRLNEIAWERLGEEHHRQGERLLFETRPYSSNGDVLTFYLQDLRFTSTPTVADLEWFTVEIPDQTFDSLVGVDDVRRRLDEALQYLHSPSSFAQEGIRPPMGYLLYGPPGTGKTSIAKAVANESNARFIEVSGTTFERKFVGEGPQRVRKLFRTARKYAPTVVFIDELDSVGSRDDHGASDSESRVSIVNTLLSVLDGFSSNEGVLVIGATNQKDKIDDALLRSKRLGRHLEVDGPDKVEEYVTLLRQELLDVGTPNADELAQDFARWTVGMSPAEVVDTVREARLVAYREGQERIQREHFVEARNFVVFGDTQPEEDEEYQRQTALHEAGHALVTAHYDRPLLQVTIVGRGNAAGFQESERDSPRTKEELLERIDILLAAREAEKLKSNTLSTGASSDLRKATRLAISTMYRLGLREEEAGLISIGDMSMEEVAQHPHLHREVQDFLDERAEHVRSILSQREDQLEALRSQLVENETLYQEEVQDLLSDVSSSQ